MFAVTPPPTLACLFLDAAFGYGLRVYWYLQRPSSTHGSSTTARQASTTPIQPQRFFFATHLELENTMSQH